MAASTPQKSRESLLTVVLALLLGGSFAFFLDLVTLGYFRWIIVTVIGITLVGYLHYVLWGYSLSQDVAGEREELEIKDRQEHDYEQFRAPRY